MDGNIKDKTAKARKPRRAEPQHPFPVEGWDGADLRGFRHWPSAGAEEGKASLRSLGFEQRCAVESYHNAHRRRDRALDEFSLWEHPQGIIAIMSTTTGGFKTEKMDGAGLEVYDPGLRKVNAIQWIFQLLAGCGAEARRGLGQVGGSGGAWVGEDGCWGESRSCQMMGMAGSVVRSIQNTGRILALKNWVNGGSGNLHLPSQLWLGLDGGREGPDELRSSHSGELFDKWMAKLPEATREGIEAGGPRSLRPTKRVTDVGPYLSRCVAGIGRRWTTEGEKRLHAVWDGWVSDENGVEAIPLDASEAFKVSDCGATALQCLLSDCHNERSLRLALGFVLDAPLSKLSKVANAVDGRGASAGMRCFEICCGGVSKETARGARQVFEALASRLGSRLRMRSASASAIGLLFSDADRPRGQSGWATNSAEIEALFISAERHGTAWASGGLRCPHPKNADAAPCAPAAEPGRKDKGAAPQARLKDDGPPWIEPRQSKAMVALARRLASLGCPGAAALAEAKELSSGSRVKNPAAPRRRRLSL